MRGQDGAYKEFTTSNVIDRLTRLISELKKASLLKELPIHFAINVDPDHLDDGLADAIIEKASACRISKYIEIEITEGGHLTEHCQREINKLRRNFKICQDDFGQDRANIQRLGKLNPSLVKLDKIVADQGKKIFSSDRNSQCISHLVEFIKSYPHPQPLVLAEGVEDLDIINLLARSGVDQFQGYYFSKPLSINDFVPYAVYLLSQGVECAHLMTYRSFCEKNARSNAI